jgi:simple sugar transport system ATP-binding protein
MDGLVVRSARGAMVVRGVTLSLRRGEIVGVAGVQGNGQSELVQAIAGLIPASAGRVKIGGVDVTWASPRARAERGLAHIPEDRQARGLILDFDVAHNLILGRHRDYAGPLGLDRAKIGEYAVERIRALDIQPPDPSIPASSLSGGNQQKVVVARELSRAPLRVLVAAEPTRGVDFAASAEIHRRILGAADAGAGVLLVSSDLAELRALAHRIVVVYRGVIVCDLPAGDANDEIVGAFMTGARGRTAVELAPT